MKRLISKIDFEKVTFNFVNTVEIESSYDNLTDTAKIIVPKKITYNGEPLASGENSLFKRGTKGIINLGYDNVLNERFKGYISGVNTYFPLEISLQDEMYFLKQNTNNFSLKNPTLEELIKKIMPSSVNYKIHVKQNIGDIRVKRSSTAQILNELRKKHGIYSFFRNGVLNIGLAVVPSLQKTVRFYMFKDIINSDNLTFVNDFDRKIKLVAKSIKNDNSQLEAEAGDSEGETRTLFFYNIANVKDLQAIADQKVKELKYTGYEGDFDTFLTPIVQHGDIIEIINPQILEQSGGYICDKVTVNFGMNGGRQKISIKQKIYNLELNNSGEWIKKDL